jgi:hypothetical protein
MCEELRMSTMTSSGQLTLPGQAAAPAGPLDLSGMFLVHFAVRRDLLAFTAAAARTPVSDRKTWKALGKRWGRLGSVLHKHHTAEDGGLWPLLLERVRAADDRKAVEMLEAMSAEHDKMDLLLGRCSGTFARLASLGCDSSHLALPSDLAQLSALVHGHLRHEERDALALVQQYLTVEEWQRLEKEIFSKAYKPRDSSFALCWTLHGLPDEGREALFARPDAPPRVTWTLKRPGFTRRERRAFRYVPRGAEPRRA